MPRSVVVLAFVTLAACSGTPAGPVIIDQPGRVVVVHDPAPTNGTDASSPDTPDAMSDAADASMPDAASAMCLGPNTVGPASTNCAPIGPCSLDTCTTGEAYRCAGRPSVGYPSGNMVCVHSTADSTVTEGVVHCCVKSCVREDRYDGACISAGPGLPHAFHCPPGIMPSVQHQAETSQGVADLYCAP
jgi:hypothetical protein